MPIFPKAEKTAKTAEYPRKSNFGIYNISGCYSHIWGVTACFGVIFFAKYNYVTKNIFIKFFLAEYLKFLIFVI